MQDTHAPPRVSPSRPRCGQRAVALAALLVAACGPSSPDALVPDAPASTVEAPTTSGAVTTAPATTTTTSPPLISSTTTTTTTEAPPASHGLDEVFLADLLAMLPIPAGRGAALAVVIDAEGEVVSAAKGSDHEGNPPTPDDRFRVGSISKIFAALVTLQLVDAGVVDLDAPVGRYVTRVEVPEGVLVRDLLQHTSGIHDYVDALWYEDRYQDQPDDPQTVWSPESLFEIVEDRRPLFEPGARYQYSNSNYLILGILIEEVTGNSYAQELRSRIIDRLGLESTHLAWFEDGPPPFDAYYWTDPLRGGVAPVDFDYTAIATSAWAGGAMVSAAADLHTLLTAVTAERIVSGASLEVMTGSGEDGPSIFLPPSNQGVYWHTGHITGYLSFVGHAPSTGTTVFLAVTTDRYARRFYEDVVENVRQELQTHAAQ